MKTLIVIPARYGSSRFPGKPLALIGGRSLVFRTWAIARAAAGSDGVCVATDHSAIYEHVTAFGGKAVMTSERCVNGTERVYEAVQQLGLEPEIVVNLQGDAALTPPWVIEDLVKEMQADAGIGLATPAVRLNPPEYQSWRERKQKGDATGTFVTFDRRFNALYFSKALIPFVRSPDKGDLPVYRHIGIYGYRPTALANYLRLQASPLEAVEGLEQLRALENGVPLRVVVVDYRGRSHCSVDKPEDARRAEEIIAKEGELVSF